MANDLTGQNIQDTYQRVIQKGADGQLFDGTGSGIPIKVEGNDIRISGSLIAQQYIVSSSVTNVTFQQQSGSTIFGDSQDDIHQFTGSLNITGHITASGNISASGNIYGNDIYSDQKYTAKGSTVINNDGTTTYFGAGNKTEIDGTNIKLDAPVTASGNISASGYIQTSELKGDLALNTGLQIAGYIFLSGSDIGHVTASGNISSSGNIIASEFHGDGSNLTNISATIPAGTYSSSLQTLGNITSSGNISASGTVVGSNLSGINTGDQDLGTYMLSVNTASFAVTSSNVLFGAITASGNISSSGTGSFRYLTTTRTGNSSTVGSSSVLQIVDAPSANETVGDKVEINFYTNQDSLASNLVHAGIGIDKTSTDGNEIADLYFHVSSIGGQATERMRISSSGNVGIGTSTPGELLEVAGNISASSIYSSGHISGSFISASKGFWTAGNVSASGDIVTAGNVSASGDIVTDGNLYVNNAAGLYADKIRRRTDSDNTTKILLNDEILKFHTGDSSNETLKMKESSSLFTGNITASAAVKVEGHISASGNIKTNSNIVAKGSAYVGTHDGTDYLFVERFSSTYPYAHIFAGSVDNDIKVGMKLVPRNTIGASFDGLVIDGGTGETTLYAGLGTGTGTPGDGHITASGNISASGTIYGSTIYGRQFEQITQNFTSTITDSNAETIDGIVYGTIYLPWTDNDTENANIGNKFVNKVAAVPGRPVRTVIRAILNWELAGGNQTAPDGKSPRQFTASLLRGESFTSTAVTEEMFECYVDSKQGLGANDAREHLVFDWRNPDSGSARDCNVGDKLWISLKSDNEEATNYMATTVFEWDYGSLI